MGSVEAVELERAEVKHEIASVSANIKEAEDELKNLKEAEDAGVAADPAQVQYWRDEKKQLREKEKLLREKEKLLLEEKARLQSAGDGDKTALIEQLKQEIVKLSAQIEELQQKRTARLLERRLRNRGAEPMVVEEAEFRFLLEEGESSFVDYKEICRKPNKSGKPEIQPKKEKIAITASAFANARGGVIIYGVSDKKDIVGVPNDLRGDALRHITDALKDCADPPIISTVHFLKVQDCGQEKWVIVVDIPPATLPSRVNGDLYQRHGDSAQKLAGVLARDLEGAFTLEVAFGKAGDSSPVEGAHVEQFLDRGKLEDFKLGHLADKPWADIVDVLAKCNLVHRDKRVLTVAGLMLLGRGRWQEQLPSAACFCISVQRYSDDAGPDTPYTAAAYVGADDFCGTVAEIVTSTVKHLDTLQQTRYTKGVVDGVFSGKLAPQYDVAALTETVVNGLVHRSYLLSGAKVVIKVRRRTIEVLVPGNFMPSVTVENLGTVSVTANPTVARFMELYETNTKRRLFERQGMGVLRAREQTAELGGKITWSQPHPGIVKVLIEAANTPPASPEASPESSPNKDKQTCK